MTTRRMDKVLVTVQYPPHHFDRMSKVFAPAELLVVDKHDDEAMQAALEVADAAVIEGDLDERFWQAPKMKWVHCDHAGLNGSARPEVFERGLLVTGSSGRSAPVLAEHVMLFALLHVYQYANFYEAQKKHQWGVPGYEQLRGLYGKTMGIIGLGHTGKELAVRASAFGMRVLGYRHSAGSPPPSVDQLYSAAAGDSLDTLLQESDIVALAVPLSDDTHHLIGEKELQLMKPTACLINMARGAVVDEAALVKALHDGEIGGAGLDTFVQEPMPADDPLWDAPNTYITPHCTPAVPDRIGRSLDVICENAVRFREGRELLNLLRKEQMYTKG